jgi:hypothetical protein
VQEVTAPSKTAKTRGTVLRKANQGAIRATKSAIKLQGEVDSFNRRFRVGDPVDYLEVIEEGKAERLTVASPAYIMAVTPQWCTSWARQAAWRAATASCHRE